MRQTPPYAILAIALNALILAILLIWNVQLRYVDFQANQQRLSEAAGLIAANQVTRLIGELRHKLEIFVSQQHALIASAARSDPGAEDILRTVAVEYFKDYLAMTITDAAGEIVLPHFSPPVGEQCQQDLRGFVKNPHLPHIFVHPDPEGYHFDLMQVWQDKPEQKSGVFFVSIKLDTLAALLRDTQFPGQRILLVKRGTRLLEIDALGSRLQHPETDYYLSADLPIAYTQPIVGTLWDLIVIADPLPSEHYLTQLWYDAGYALALVVILTLIALGIAFYLRRQLALAQAQLLHSDKLAALGQMVAGIAHEMNTPLAYVRSNLEIWLTALRNGAQAPCWQDPEHWNEQKALAEDCLSGVDRVAAIVHTLRDFSRIDRAEQIAYDLHEGLEVTLRIATPLLRSLNVVKHYASQLPPVPCDPAQIHQVLLNLITNAIQAMQGRGDLILATGYTSQEVWVSITDTGPGIAPRHLRRLGEPFFTTKPQGEGLGLGLTISYSIVKQHRGRLEVHSRVGHGTRFTLWLPRQ